MTFSVATIMKAVEIVGAATPVAAQIVAGFRDLLSSDDEAELQARYRQAREDSDRVHRTVQDTD